MLNNGRIGKIVITRRKEKLGQLVDDGVDRRGGALWREGDVGQSAALYISVVYVLSCCLGRLFFFMFLSCLIGTTIFLVTSTL